jgi:hypothetical protein
MQAASIAQMDFALCAEGGFVATMLRLRTMLVGLLATLGRQQTLTAQSQVAMCVNHTSVEQTPGAVTFALAGENTRLAADSVEM